MFTVIVPNAKTETPVPLIKAQVRPDSVVYTDTFGAYGALDVSDFRHHRINHSRLFAEQVNHINGIENFGTKPTGICAASTGLSTTTFNGSLKSANGASMPARTKSC